MVSRRGEPHVDTAGVRALGGRVTILLTQASFTSAIVPDWVRDFATSAYQAIAA